MRREGGGGGLPSLRSSGGAHRSSWKHSPVLPASASAAPRQPSKRPPPDRLGAAPGKQGWPGWALLLSMGGTASTRKHRPRLPGWELL